MTYSNHFTISIIVLIKLIYVICNSASSSSNGPVFVHEMDDRVIEFTNQGKWLITFYAPWCGHCRKLEPVFEEVGKYYHGKQINIVKVDATRFVKAANHFDVKGYPTIKYIDGKTILNFNGERSKEDIIEFVERVEAPRVNKIKSRLDFEHIKSKVSIFFLIIARFEDQKTQLFNDFNGLADRYFLDAYFYSSQPDYIMKGFNSTTSKFPLISVVKDGNIIFYDENEYQSINNFIKNEQFVAFTKISLTNFHNLVDTKKYLVILLTNSLDEIKKEATKNETFRNYLYTILKRKFQFGFTENHDLINGIAIWTLSCPVLFILNSSSYEYSIVNVIDGRNLTLLDINLDNVLKDIIDGKIEIFGGHSMFRSIRRPLWEIYRAIIEMFIEAPFISLLIFGFPFGVISIVFYFLCCLDTNDSADPEDYSDTEDEGCQEQIGAENDDDADIDNRMLLNTDEQDNLEDDEKSSNEKTKNKKNQ